MRKFRLITATMLLIVSLLTLSVACDDKNTEKKDAWQILKEEFEAETSEKVTDEEFALMIEDAADADNYRMKSSQTFEDGRRVTLFYDRCGDREKTVQMTSYPEGIEVVEYCYQYKDGDSYYNLTSLDEIRWEKKLIESEILISLKDNYYLELLQAIKLYHDNDDLTDIDYVGWNEKGKGYLIETGVYSNVFKFKDGRVSLGTYDDNGLTDLQEVSVIYDVGKVPEIKLPEIAE